MLERRVWIAQCLCGPNRHRIMAAVAEADTEAQAKLLGDRLRENVADRLQSSLNPRCAICGATEAGWQYEVDRTAWRSMVEAAPALVQNAADQALTNAVYGTHGPSRPRPN